MSPWARRDCRDGEPGSDRDPEGGEESSPAEESYRDIDVLLTAILGDTETGKYCRMGDAPTREGANARSSFGRVAC